MKKKEKIDFLNAIKAGHSGFIAGNPAHALDDKTSFMTTRQRLRPVKQVAAKKLLSQSIFPGLYQSVFQLKKLMK